MVRECRHTMPTGVHCQSPAMRHSAYCYHHDRLHRYPREARLAKKPVHLPKLDNRDALLAGLTDVMNAILARKVDPRQGGSLIYGMQVAAYNIGKASAQNRITPTRIVSAKARPRETPAPAPAAKSPTLP